MLVEKYGWAIQKSSFAQTNQDSTFSHTCENPKFPEFLHVIPVSIIVPWSQGIQKGYLG